MNFTQVAKLYAPVIGSTAGIASTFITHDIFSFFGGIALGLFVSLVCVIIDSHKAPATTTSNTLTNLESDYTNRLESNFVVSENYSVCFGGLNLGTGIS